MSVCELMAALVYYIKRDFHVYNFAINIADAGNEGQVVLFVDKACVVGRALSAAMFFY